MSTENTIGKAVTNKGDNKISRNTISYEDSGVSTKKGAELVSSIGKCAKETHNNYVLNSLGSFAAMYDHHAFMQQHGAKFQEPVLVSGTDGVGTKLLIAIEHNEFDGIGQDCVAMCLNDILCHGAKPLFFLDYLACGTLEPIVARHIVKGIAQACKVCDCALVGGETAEMPSMYKPGDYDLAGFALGIVGKQHIIDGSEISEGDAIIACASSGLHSNGFSLVRTVFADNTIDHNAMPLYKTLLEPTRLYVRSILQVLNKFNYNANTTTSSAGNVTDKADDSSGTNSTFHSANNSTASSDGSTADTHKIIKGLAHITGGGIIENLPRIIPEGLRAVIARSQIPQLDIYRLIRSTGKVEETELWNTFNMGIGMVLVVANAQAAAVQQMLINLGEDAYIIGEILNAECNSQAYKPALNTAPFIKEQKIWLL